MGRKKLEKTKAAVDPEAPRRRYERRPKQFKELPSPEIIPINQDIISLTSDPEMYFLPMAQDEIFLINPYACGVSSWLPKAKLHRRNCAFFSMELVLEGEGELNVNGNTYSLKPHDVFLLHFNEEHTYQNVGTGRWKKVWIAFRHSLMTPGLTQLGLDMISKITLKDQDFEQIRRLFFDVLDDVRDRGRDFRIDSSATCYKIFHLLARYAKAISSQRTNVVPAQIQAVLSYVEKHLREPISMEDLANVAGCCRVHLTRLFKKHMGIHTRDWLIQLRMRHACMMLKTTNLPVHIIAEEVGFDDPYHFSTAFRRTVGQPPTKYRKQSKGGGDQE
ncbi:helix-turn-helix transcriptional regulator [bacterium]|nr:helix-turn-helix transcriptional regulator [bacterium]